MTTIIVDSDNRNSGSYADFDIIINKKDDVRSIKLLGVQTLNSMPNVMYGKHELYLDFDTWGEKR